MEKELNGFRKKKKNLMIKIKPKGWIKLYGSYFDLVGQNIMQKYLYYAIEITATEYPFVY